MSYTHRLQIVRVIENCGKDKIICQVEEMSKSLPDSNMSFINWKDRLKIYDFTLKEFLNNKNIYL